MSSKVRIGPSAARVTFTASVRISLPCPSSTIASRSSRSISAASSGEMLLSGLPTSVSSGLSRSEIAERLISRIMPSGETEITPAVTPDITASISARRLSSAPVCACSRSVIWLNALPSVPSSSWTRVSGTRADRSPVATLCAAATSAPTGRTSRSATSSAIHTAIAMIRSDIANSAALNFNCSERDLAIRSR